MQTVSAILVAAGNATRMGGMDKQFLSIGGIPVFLHSILKFSKLSEVKDIVVVTKAESIDRMKMLCSEYTVSKPLRFVIGGATRQDSVLQGIQACDPSTAYVAVHDGARPLVREEDIRQVIADAKRHQAATLGVPAKDTLKLTNQQGFITSTPPRDRLSVIQTPQVFERSLYLQGVEHARLTGQNFTDDCQLVEAIGAPVFVTRGSYENLKITTPEDIRIANALFSGSSEEVKQKGSRCMRIGHGYDVHKLTEGRKLILGGVDIPHTVGLLGHSDADVLLHAIMDALLGAAALGDIGKHFPDTDNTYKGADSLLLLSHVAKLLQQQGYTVENIDSTIIAQKPKLAPYIQTMRQNIANACGIDISQVNVKATTEEKLGFTGECLGISAHAVALLERA